MLENLAWFILIPLWCAILVISTRFSGIILQKKHVVLMSCCSVLFPLIYSVLGLYITYKNEPVEMCFSFLSINNLTFSLGLYVDMLSSLVGIVVSLITLIVFLYSAYYMEKEKSFSRYYSLLNLFFISMLAFVFSPNLFQMLLSWDLIGAFSYLLIGYWYNKPVVSMDSKRVYLINILGDIALFSAFVITSNFVVSMTENISLSSLPLSEINLITSSLLASTTPQMYSVIVILFVVAGIVKSAQFPINSWLINAMSAPTPVSALIHSSTLVMTGAFLLLRVFPIVASDILSVKLIIAIGFITAILTSLSACVQTNIKKALAYSTSAQLGLVFVAIGLFNPVAGIVYLLSHAFIKALMFMCAGNVIKLTESKNVMFMGNLRKELPYTAIAFIVAGLALSGLGFCGFNSKCLISDILINSPSLLLLFGIVGALTTYYVFRLYFLVFEGEKQKNIAYQALPNKKCSIMSLGTLVFIIVCGTFLIPAGRICVFYFINLLMLGIVALIYYKKYKLPKIRTLQKIFINGFYINKIYYWGEVYIYRFLSLLMYVFDSYVVGGVEYITKSILFKISACEQKLQSNNVQYYISYGFWILLLVMMVFLVMYMFILNIFGV